MEELLELGDAELIFHRLKNELMYLSSEIDSMSEEECELLMRNILKNTEVLYSKQKLVDGNWVDDTFFVELSSGPLSILLGTDGKVVVSLENDEEDDVVYHEVDEFASPFLLRLKKYLSSHIGEITVSPIWNELYEDFHSEKPSERALMYYLLFEL